MANDLQAEVQAAADAFAKQLLEIFQSAVLGNLSVSIGQSAPRGRRGPARAASGKRLRRSQADIDNLAGEIVRALKSARAGLRAEQLREKLGVERKLLPRALADALAKKTIRKTGKKRATTYYAR